MLSTKKLLYKILQSINGVTSTPIGINTSGASGSGTVYKWGRMCVITATIKPSTTGTTLKLANVRDDLANLPITDTWLSCDFYHNATQEAEAKITTDGYIEVSTPISGSDLKISGAYISAS